MDLFQAIVLGVVQGFSEFLPISSTAHLILVPWFMGWKDPGLTFDVALHLGTFIAVATYFWADLRMMLGAWLESFRAPRLREDVNQRLAWFVIAGTLPAAVLGLMFEHKIETTLRSPYVIVATMIGVALLLALGEFVGKRVKDVKNLKLLDAVLVGFAQASALIPGTSRSGATMTAAMFMGFTREAAARFSFLLGTPIIFASCLFKGKDYFETFGAAHPELHGGALLQELGNHLMTSPNSLPFLAGVIASTVVGYLSIRFLMTYLQKRSLWIFIAYRLVMGAIILGLILTNRLPAAVNVG